MPRFGESPIIEQEVQPQQEQAPINLTPEQTLDYQIQQANLQQTQINKILSKGIPEQHYGGPPISQVEIQNYKNAQAQAQALDDFNKNLAITYPEKANPTYVNQAYEEAKNALQTNVDQEKGKITYYQNIINQEYIDAANQGRSVNDNVLQNMDKNISEANIRLNIYQNALSDKFTAIKQYFSGNVYSNASSSISNFEQAQKLNQFAQAQPGGFTTFYDWQTAQQNAQNAEIYANERANIDLQNANASQNIQELKTEKVALVNGQIRDISSLTSDELINKRIDYRYVYVDPQTGERITDLDAYYKSHNIKTSSIDNLPLSVQMALTTDIAGKGDVNSLKSEAQQIASYEYKSPTLMENIGTIPIGNININQLIGFTNQQIAKEYVPTSYEEQIGKFLRDNVFPIYAEIGKGISAFGKDLITQKYDAVYNLDKMEGTAYYQGATPKLPPPYATESYTGDLLSGSKGEYYIPVSYYQEEPNLFKNYLDISKQVQNITPIKFIGDIETEVAKDLGVFGASVLRGALEVSPIKPITLPIERTLIASVPEENRADFETNIIPTVSDIGNLALAAGIAVLPEIGGAIIGPLVTDTTDLAFGGMALEKGYKMVTGSEDLSPKNIADELLLGTVPFIKFADWVEESPFLEWDRQALFETRESPTITSTAGKVRSARLIPKIIDDVTGEELGIGLGEFKGKGIFGTIGGKIEEGETPFHALLRETLEETFGLKNLEGKSENQLLTLLKDKGISEPQFLARWGSREEIADYYTIEISKSNWDKLAASDDLSNFRIFEGKDYEDLIAPTKESVRFKRTAPLADALNKVLGIDYGPKLRIRDAEVLSRMKAYEEINKRIDSLSESEFKSLSKEAKDYMDKKFKDILDLYPYSDRQYIVDYLLSKKGLLQKAGILNVPLETKGIDWFGNKEQKYIKIYTESESQYDFSPKTLNKLFDATIKKMIYEKGTVGFYGKYMDITGDLLKENELKTSKAIAKRLYQQSQYVTSASTEEPILTGGEFIVKGEKFERGEKVLFTAPGFPITSGGEGIIYLDYALGWGEKQMEISLLPKNAKSQIVFGKTILDKTLYNEASILRDAGYSYKEVAAYLQEKGKPGLALATAKSIFGIEKELGYVEETKLPGAERPIAKVKLEGRTIQIREFELPKRGKMLNEEKFDNKAVNEMNELLKKPEFKEKVNKIIEKESEIPKLIEYKSILEFAKVTPSETRELSIKSEYPKIITEKENMKLLESEKPIKITELSKEPIISEYPKFLPKEDLRFIYKEKIPRETIKEFPKEKPFKNIIEKPIEIPIKVGKEKEKKQQLFKQNQGFNVYVKEVVLKHDKTEKPKNLKVNVQPITEFQAESLGAYVVEHSLARKFTVKQTKQKAQPPSGNFPENYWADEAYKFREYKIRHGVKIPTEKTFIEKSMYLLDTPEQINKLSAAKEIASLRKQGKSVSQNEIDYAINLIS